VGYCSGLHIYATKKIIAIILAGPGFQKLSFKVQKYGNIKSSHITDADIKYTEQAKHHRRFTKYSGVY